MLVLIVRDIAICRGNSKYHYYGIRVKLSSPLHELPINDDDDGDENDCVSPSGAESKSDPRQLMIVQEGIHHVGSAPNDPKPSQSSLHAVESSQGDSNAYKVTSMNVLNSILEFWT